MFIAVSGVSRFFVPPRTLVCRSFLNLELAAGRGVHLWIGEDARPGEPTQLKHTLAYPTYVRTRLGGGHVASG